MVRWTPAGGGQIINNRTNPSSGVGPAPVQNNASGSSPAAVNAMIANTPSRPAAPVTSPTPPEGTTPPGGGGQGGQGVDMEALLAAARAAAAEEARRQAAIAEERRVNEALAAAKTFFQTYGMDALWNGVEKLVRAGYNDAQTISGILSRDPEYQAAYFSRFPAVQRIRELNKTRQQQGLPIMAEPAPATYVGLEEGYRQALVGLPRGLWGSSQDVADWIVKDVSPQEVASRVTVAKNFINYSANASIKRELRAIYGMTDEEMVSYVLDEDGRTLAAVESQYQSRMRQATVGGAAADAGLAISTYMRDQLAGNDAYGQSYGNTLAGMQNVAQIADAYSMLGRMSGISTTTEELVTDQFGLTGAAEVSQKKRKLSSQERARFGGSSAITAKSLDAKPIGAI